MAPPTVSDLARLFGVREDDPARYEHVEETKSSISELNDALSSSKKSSSLLAQFLSLYLPSLLDVLSNYPSSSPIASPIIRLLYLAQKLRVPHSLRALLRCEDAHQLPRILVERVTQSSLVGVLPRPSSSSSSSLTKRVQTLSRNLSVLLHLITTSLRFGPASKCSFQLPPDLLVDLERVGTQFLQTPYLQAVVLAQESSEEVEIDLTAETLRELLVEVMGRFGVGDEREVRKYEKEREEMLGCGREDETRERFWCELSKREMDRGGGVRVCSKCYSVAYCGEIDQKKDWKRHKLMCFKPSWTELKESTIAGGVGEEKKVLELVFLSTWAEDPPSSSDEDGLD